MRLPWRLSKPQSKVLAAFSVGIAKEKGCGLNAAAKKLPFVGNPATVERRIQRFIANDWIDHAESCRATAKWVIGDRKAIVAADRGIGNSPKPLGEIEGLGMFYLMRVAKKVRVMMEDGEVAPFDEMPNAPGKSWRSRARALEVGQDRMLGGARMGLRPRGAVVFGDELPGVGGQGVWYSHVDRADV